MSTKGREESQRPIGGGMPANAPDIKKPDPLDEKLGLAPRPLIHEGQYLFRCFHAESLNYTFGRRVILHLEITEGPAAGTRLFFAARRPEKDKLIPIGSKLYRAALLLHPNGYRLERRDHVTLRDFIGVVFRGTVRTTEAKDGEEEGYSIVAQLLEKVEVPNV